MSHLNTKIVAALVIHILLTTIIVMGDPEMGQFIIFLFGPAVLGNLIGIILMKGEKRKLGARIFLFSSIVFVPIGVIGVMGARAVLDQIASEEFFNQ